MSRRTAQTATLMSDRLKAAAAADGPLPYRKAPHNLEAEQALLGAILYENSVLERVSPILDAHHLYDPLHQQIYETAAKLILAGKQATPITLRTFFETAEPISPNLTVPQYLGTLVGNATAHPVDYAHTVRDLATRRALIIAGEDVVNAAYDTAAGADPLSLIATAEQKFGGVRNGIGGACPSAPISAAALAGKPVPPRIWAIDPIVPNCHVATIGGEGEVGKSTIIQQLCTAAPSGAQWLGFNVRRGPAVYLNAEDDHKELHRRQANICREMQVDFEKLADLHLWSIAQADETWLAEIDDRGALRPTPLWRHLERLVAKVRPSIIAVDPLAALFIGNEVSRAHARQFINMLRRMAIRNDAAVILGSHPSLSGIAAGTGNSGSTDWGNSVRCRMFMKRIVDGNGKELDEDVRLLKVNKINYGVHREIPLRWQNGVFVPDDGTGRGSEKRAFQELQLDALFIELLEIYAAEKRDVNASSGPNYAPTVFAADHRSKGASRDALRAAMNRLLAAKRIANEEHGRASKRARRLVVL